MSAESLDLKTFEEKVKKSKTAVLVDFFATWCGPCQAMSPIIDELADEKEYEVYKVDVDENNDLASSYEIASIPTVVIFKDGKEVNRLQGLQNKENLLKELKKA